MSALFHSESVRVCDDDRSVVVEGVVVEGHIVPGMLLTIGFNSSFGMSVPITCVIPSADDRLTLVLDCNDKEGAEFVEAMNFADELLKIEPPSTV